MAEEECVSAGRLGEGVAGGAGAGRGHWGAGVGVRGSSCCLPTTCLSAASSPYYWFLCSVLWHFLRLVCYLLCVHLYGSVRVEVKWSVYCKK